MRIIDPTEGQNLKKFEREFGRCMVCDGLGLAPCEKCKTMADECKCKDQPDTECIWCSGTGTMLNGRPN